MTILLLAGTREAQHIATALAEQGLDVVASLAGVTRVPVNLGVRTRRGGFGGADGFRREVKDLGITAVLDATHPFAHRISLRTASICKEMDLPYCQLLRPAWKPDPGDKWTVVADEADVAAHVLPGQIVFLATGRQTLARFENLSHARLYCRQIDPPDKPFPFPNGDYIVGRPPFAVDAEIALFQRLKIDWLVVKNAGGDASKSKLVAARQLGLDVAMIDRPPQPDAFKVTSVEAALAWADSLQT